MYEYLKLGHTVIPASVRRSKTIVRVEHQGACRVPVASARASVNATEEDCPKMCYMNLDYVCGTDGKTYSNLCQLQTEACK